MTKVTQDHHQFYLTAPTPCPYLPGLKERKVFTHLVGSHAGALNEVLSQGGFRRSQSIAYRPACDGCSACISVRIVVDEFKPSQNMRRVLRHNTDLVGRHRAAEASSEQYSLFRHYLESRHAEGGMAQMSVLDYALMVEDSHVETMLVEYRRRGPDSAFSEKSDGDLVGCALTDVLSDGLSMVYSFYDPGETARSMGTLMILEHVERARRMGKPYVYLGYWVDGSGKMGYKARFLPQERLLPQGWTRFD